MMKIRKISGMEKIIILAVLVVIIAVSMPKIFEYYQKSQKVSTAKERLEAIRDYQEVYRMEHNKYIPCSSNPSEILHGAAEWQEYENSGWSKIGYSPENKVCFQYEVKTDADNLSFTAYARGDLDKDNKYLEISLDQDGRWICKRVYK
jgi:type II secretory pathway pseudopilin PulG